MWECRPLHIKADIPPPAKKCVNAKANGWLNANREWKRRLQQTRRYGLRPEALDQMIEDQAGLCGICLKPMKPGKETHIDHDHNTGVIRGLLCHHCNRGVGLFQEDRLALLNANTYLQLANSGGYS